jgi:hypothetical protein
MPSRKISGSAVRQLRAAIMLCDMQRCCNVRRSCMDGGAVKGEERNIRPRFMLPARAITTVMFILRLSIRRSSHVRERRKIEMW